MPKFFRSISGKEMVKILKQLDFYEVSQKGSHMKLKRRKTTGEEIVPNHKELTPGTFRNILKMSGLGLEAFDQLNS